MAINARFAFYYGDLYSSRVGYFQDELASFLDQINFPTLNAIAREHLDSTITIEEVQQALGEMQAGDRWDSYRIL